MSWEARGARQYYYRGRRQQGRVVKHYCGAGADAQAAAAEDLARKEQQQHRKTLQRQLEVEIEILSGVVVPFWRASDRLFELALVANHYHYRRGEWRRRRANNRVP